MHGKESPEVALSTNCCAKSNKHNMCEQCNSQTFVPVVLISLMEHSFPSWNVLKAHHFPDRTMYSTPDGDHLREHSVNCRVYFHQSNWTAQTDVPDGLLMPALHS